MTGATESAFQKVTAIIRSERLEHVEKALQSHGIHGASITRVKGYGESTNLYRDDWLEGHARIEVFISTDKTDALVQVILDAAYVGLEGDGIIAVLPVTKIYRIRTRQPALPEDL